MRWITIALVLQGILTVAAINDDGRVTQYVPEEQEAGYIVANMARIFSLRFNERQSRTFKLLSQSLVTKNPASTKQDVNLLTLDKNSGVIVTSQILDREELCQNAEKCIIEVQAVMLPNEFFTMLNMDVIIEDVNDNSPVFPVKNIKIVVAEDELSRGDSVNLDIYKASDKDIGSNAELGYDLEDNPYFSIETYEDDSGVQHLQLAVLDEPDYEKTPSLELTLTATDNGEEPLTSSASLVIDIADSNDHDPVFDQREYTVRLKENDVQQHIVATVHAEDEDSGDYGAVRYFIPEPSSDDRTGILASELLSINELTGEITLKRKVDRETHDGLRVTIEAKDSDPIKPHVGKTKLIIEVEDVNDNAPVIKVNFIVDSINQTGYIPESASIKTYIASVSATDLDNGENGKVTSQITTFGQHKGQKELRKLNGQFTLSDDGLLATGRALDREISPLYIIEIKSCDHGTPAKCTVENITIIVLDVNDNPPIFDSSAKAVMIAEDKEVGTFIINVHAEDKDAKYSPLLWKNKDGQIEESRNGIVRYSIIEGNTEFFEIDPASGDIKLKKQLDHESQQEWKLIIEARDGGWQTYSRVNCSIVIRVHDVNDNRPIFVRPSEDNEEVYATILREQIILTIEALDSDSGSNSKITYEILQQDGRPVKRNHTISAFILNPNTGDLRLNFSRKNLTDFLGRHTLLIQAKDSGDKPLSATVLLHVAVINDLLPDPVSTAGFDEKYILLAITLGAASCILIMAIVCIVVCRRRKDKKLRTYNCRNAEKKSSAWISAPINMSEAKAEEGKYFSASAMTSTTSSPTKFHADGRSDAIVNQETRKPDMMEKNEMTTFKKESKNAPNSAVLSTVRAQDRDSGRGDSDSETGNYTNIDEPVTRNEVLQRLDERSSQYQESQNDDESTRTSELGPQCDENCRTHGHSDTCWMPSPTSDIYQSGWPRTRGLKYGLTASAPRLDVPTYYDYDNSASQTNEYPTLHHLPSTGHYSPLPEYYRTMSLSPRHPSDQYYHAYEGDLAPIDEMVPLNENYIDQAYEGDDVSAQTQMTLSTTSPRIPEQESAESYVRAASRASLASSRDYPQTSWQN